MKAEHQFSLLVVVVVFSVKSNTVAFVVTRQMRERQKKLEEILRWKPTSARSVSLPRLSSFNANSFTFTISNGLRWKVRFLEFCRGYAADYECATTSTQPGRPARVCTKSTSESY